MEEDKCKQIGTLVGDKWDKMHDIAKRVYDTEHLAPTIHTMGGGNLEPKVLIKNLTKQGYTEATVGDGIDISSRMEYHRGTVQKGASQTITTSCDVGVIEPSGVYTSVSADFDRGPLPGLSRSLKAGNNDAGVIEPIIYDDYNSRIKADQSCVGTLTTNCGNDAERNGTKIIEKNQDFRIRKLTPKECWRLMNFDDTDIEKAKAVGISDSQLYKQAGNSIVVSVLQAIFKEML